MSEIENKTENDWKQIHYYARDGDANGIKREIFKDISCVNAVKKDGWTALHLACLNNYTDCVKELLANSADLSLKESSGNTPVDLVLIQNNQCLKIIYSYLNLGPLNTLIIKNNFNEEEADKIYKAEEKTEAEKAYSISGVHIAAIFNNIPALKYLIEKKKLDINIQDKYQNTALHQAVVGQSAESIMYLLDHGANINAQNSRGFSPIFLAVRYESLQLVSILLEKGAQIDIMNWQGTSLLHFASIIGNRSCVDALLNHPEMTQDTINKCKTDGKTPLHLAAQSGNLDVIKLLIQHGARVNEKYDNHSILYIAILHGDYAEIVSYFLKYAFFKNSQNISEKDRQSRLLLDDVCVPHTFTEIHLAIKYRRYDCLRTLLQSNKFDPNVVDSYDRTPLIYAAKKSSLNGLRYMIKFGANLSAKNLDKKTAVDITTDQFCKQLLYGASKNLLLPSKVEFFQCAARSPTSMTLVWTKPESYDPVTRYLVEIKSEDGSIKKKIQHSTGFDITIKRLIPKVVYSLRVSAQNFFGNGEWSKSINIKTENPTEPSTIYKIDVQHRSSRTIDISWKLPDSNGEAITTFEMEIYDERKRKLFVYHVDQQIVNYKIQNLDYDSNYYVRVRSQNSVGWSNWCFYEFISTLSQEEAGLQSKYEKIKSNLDSNQKNNLDSNSMSKNSTDF
ncbi:ankyrin repeat-containing protein [Anaeramoeba ignava]|uniref:Ankyrin repeat-containing protein n=1 Tax=Anaeramoeba ignava TaxID=1746090 RepID=A0A9Q0LIK7_ANAIG|nr:ankyrin repeat-containing protein [Anaeramoeba ignava]